MNERKGRFGFARRRWLIKGALGACAAVVSAVATRDLAATHRRALQSTAPDTTLLQRMLDAEDARSGSPASAAVLHAGLRSADADARRRAARAIGRLEQSVGLSALRGVLDDPSAAVRIEAINAIAQIVSGEAQRAREAQDTSGETERSVIAAVGLLTGHAAGESDRGVRDAIVRALSRLPYPSPSAAMSAVSSFLDSDTSARADVGSAGASRISNFARVYALDGLLRRHPALRTEPTMVAAVRNLGPVGGAATRSSDADGWTPGGKVLRASVRGRLLTGALASSGATQNDASAIQRAFIADFADAGAQVRRQVIAFVAVATALDDSVRTRLVDAALRDPSFHVRVEAVRAYARRTTASCDPLVHATRDSNAHVAITAIDALPAVAACRESPQSVDRLTQIVGTLPPRQSRRATGRASWHLGAHAAVSLARIAPDRARSVLQSLVVNPAWQVRMYAATATGVLVDTATLARLANDRSDNVRDAAVNALSALVRPAGSANVPPRLERSAWVDSIFTAQLAQRDYQLVLDAARALDGARPDARLADALLAALDRITAERTETSRDPRMELLARIQAVGGGTNAARLTPYLSDFDPAIANRAATALRAWGVSDATPAPRGMTPLRVSLREVARLRHARVRITMAPQSGGGSFDLRLFVDEAPASIARFASLARRGYYNGLTFHRVATNFVIQGGSPGANEYVGHDRFMRDELGMRSHTRGTLGISTRGRDTGDAQIFVNLIDNFRLDHDYTVFAEVTSGMDVVDGVLEGDVIARVEILGAR